MSFDPFNIRDKARAIMVEQIMALEGRGHPNPRAFRDELEREPATQLAHRLELLTQFPDMDQYDTNSLDARGKTQVGKSPFGESAQSPCAQIKDWVAPVTESCLLKARDEERGSAVSEPTRYQSHLP